MRGGDPPAIIECPCQYRYAADDDRVLGHGDATVRLTGDDLALSPATGQALLFSIREMETVSTADYTITIGCESGHTLHLCQLGRHYDGFRSALARVRADVMVGDMLMYESSILPGIDCLLRRIDPDGAQTEASDCQLRLYETGLVVIPAAGDIARVPYSYVSSVREHDHRLLVEVEAGPDLEFSRLGRSLDLLRRSLTTALSQLALRNQRQLQEFLPQIDPAHIRQAALLLRDGRTAGRAELDAISPELWRGLEARLRSLGVAAKYDYLASLAQPEQVQLGFKRGLMGDLTGDYVWALLPILGVDRPGGNAIAMEAASTAGTGMATYFFRIMEPARYQALLADRELAALHDAAGELLQGLTRSLLCINFRREPIYLPDSALLEPRHAHYRLATRRLPELRMLRDSFIGRVLHPSTARWQQDVEELLIAAGSRGADLGRWRPKTVDPREPDEANSAPEPEA